MSGMITRPQLTQRELTFLNNSNRLVTINGFEYGRIEVAETIQDDAETTQDDVKTAHDDVKAAQDDVKAAQDDVKTTQDDGAARYIMSILATSPWGTCFPGKEELCDDRVLRLKQVVAQESEQSIDQSGLLSPDDMRLG